MLYFVAVDFLYFVCFVAVYFVYFVYNFIQEHLDPATEKMHFQLIKVIDQMRMLDQDLIRLQQKVDTVLEYKENEKKQTKTEKKENGEKIVKNLIIFTYIIFSLT